MGGFSDGAIFCHNSSPVLNNLLIIENSADYGGGLYFDDSEQQAASIRNSTIAGNVAGEGGGIYLLSSDYPHYGGVVVLGTIIWYNWPDEVAETNAYFEGICLSVSDNGSDPEPMFCNPEGGCFILLPESPCRNIECWELELGEITLGYTDAQCDPEEVGESITEPASFYLRQCFPNPFTHRLPSITASPHPAK